jgi:S-DNA-T family DNA segregation ATPase FtsK/SpoIIIE
MLERMEACRAAGVKAVWQLPEPPPPIVIIFDEIAELYLGDRSEKDTMAAASAALLRIAQLGAALDLHLIIAAQRFGSDTGPGVTALRAQLTGRVCLRVADKQTAEMAIGDVAPDAVEIVLMLTPNQRGSGVTVIDGRAVRVRSAMTTLEQTRATATQYADMAVALPGMDRPALPAGSVVDRDD